MKKGSVIYLRKSEAGSYFPYDSTELSLLPDKSEVIEVKVLNTFEVKHEVRLASK